MHDERELNSLVNYEEEVQEDIKKYKLNKFPFKKYSDKYSNREELEKLFKKYPWLNYQNITNQ